MRVHLPLLREAGNKAVACCHVRMGIVPSHSDRPAYLQSSTCLSSLLPVAQAAHQDGSVWGPELHNMRKCPSLASPRQHIIGTTDFLQVYLLVPFLGTTVFFNPFSLLLTDRLFQVDVTICLLRLFFLTSSFILSPAPVLGSADICHPACFYFYYWKGKKEIMCFPLTPAQPALDIVYTDVILPRRKLLRGWS